MYRKQNFKRNPPTKLTQIQIYVTGCVVAAEINFHIYINKMKFQIDENIFFMDMRSRKKTLNAIYVFDNVWLTHELSCHQNRQCSWFVWTFICAYHHKRKRNNYKKYAFYCKSIKKNPCKGPHLLSLIILAWILIQDQRQT